MKYLLLLLLALTVVSSYAQTYDTIGSDIGKPGGYLRAREIDGEGNIKRIWFTTWNEEGEIIKEFSQYDDKNRLIARVESTLEQSGRLIRLQRYIGSTIDQEDLRFAGDGTLTGKNISLHIAGNSLFYSKKNDNGWKYSVRLNANSDGVKDVSAEEYENAEKLFAKRLLTSASDANNEHFTNDQIAKGIIAEFAGNNIRNTTPFVVTSPWEVHWDAKGEFFSIYLYDEEGKLVNVLGNQTNPGEGASYYAKPGKYYFSVNTMGDWKVKVTASKQ